MFELMAHVQPPSDCFHCIVAPILQLRNCSERPVSSEHTFANFGYLSIYLVHVLLSYDNSIAQLGAAIAVIL